MYEFGPQTLENQIVVSHFGEGIALTSLLSNKIETNEEIFFLVHLTIEGLAI